MDVRTPSEGRALAEAGPAPTRALDGVPVRELDALSCFVGDLGGDCREGALATELLSPPAKKLTRPMLDVLDVLGPGLGLGALRLILLLSPASPPVPRTLPVNMLLGRLVLVLFAGAAATAGLGWASTVTVVGRTNMPWPMAQSK